MASRFGKNFTERGYTMDYLKLPDSGQYKTHVLQFLVELQGISPRIWRRIQVPANYNFWDLHVAIQDALGWWDYHMHQFEIKGKGKRKVARIGQCSMEINRACFQACRLSCCFCLLSENKAMSSL